MKPIEVSDLELAFGSRKIDKMLPALEDIPKEFHDEQNKWNKIITDWFFYGLENPAFTHEDSVDPRKAMRHIQAILASFEPKHKRKKQDANTC